MTDLVQAVQQSATHFALARKQAAQYLYKHCQGLVTWLYFKDVCMLMLRAAGTAMLTVAVLWFWAGMADIAQARIDFATADSASTWKQLVSIFWVLMVTHTGLGLFTGAYRRSLDSAIDRLTLQLAICSPAPSAPSNTPAGQ